MSSSNNRMFAEQLSMLAAPNQEMSWLKKRMNLLEKELKDKTKQLNGVPNILAEIAALKQAGNALNTRMNGYESKLQEFRTAINDLVNSVQTNSVELDVVKQHLAELFGMQMEGLSMSNPRNDTQNRGADNVENPQHQLPDLTRTEVAEPIVELNQDIGHARVSNDSDSTSSTEDDSSNDSQCDSTRSNAGSFRPGTDGNLHLNNDLDQPTNVLPNNDEIKSEAATETNKETNLAENVDDTEDYFEMNKLIIKNVKVYESRSNANSAKTADKCDLVVGVAKSGFTLSYTIKGMLHTVWLKLGGKAHPMTSCEKGVIVDCCKDEERSISQPLVLMFKSEDDIDTLKWFINDV